MLVAGDTAASAMKAGAAGANDARSIGAYELQHDRQVSAALGNDIATTRGDDVAAAGRDDLRHLVLPALVGDRTTRRRRHAAAIAECPRIDAEVAGLGGEVHRRRRPGRWGHRYRLHRGRVLLPLVTRPHELVGRDLGAMRLTPTARRQRSAIRELVDIGRRGRAARAGRRVEVEAVSAD